MKREKTHHSTCYQKVIVRFNYADYPIRRLKGGRLTDTLSGNLKPAPTRRCVPRLDSKFPYRYQCIAESGMVPIELTGQA